MLVEKHRAQPGVYTWIEEKNSKLNSFKEYKIFLSADVFLSLEIKDSTHLFSAEVKRVSKTRSQRSLTNCFFSPGRGAGIN